MKSRSFLKPPTHVKPVKAKGNQPWTFIGRTDAEAEALILWPPDGQSRLIRKDPDARKDWRQRRGDDRGWDGWMASPTQWTWVWANSRRWWWTGKPGVLQSMGVTKSQTRLSNCLYNSSLYNWSQGSHYCNHHCQAFNDIKEDSSIFWIHNITFLHYTLG